MLKIKAVSGQWSCKASSGGVEELRRQKLGTCTVARVGSNNLRWPTSIFVCLGQATNYTVCRK